MAKNKLFRITTVPQSLRGLLSGQLRFMTENGFEVLALSSNGDALIDVAQREGVPTFAVEMTRSITPLKDLRAVWRLYRVFKNEKPTIVHSHTPKAGTLGMLAAWLARVPIRMHTIAGLPLLEAKGNKRKVLDLVEKITYGCATKVYPNSKVVLNIVVQQGYAPKEKLKVIGQGSSNGIDTKHFDPALFADEDRLGLRRSLGIADTDFVFIYVGRLVRDKGINELIAAFKSIQEMLGSDSAVKLLLVGSFEKELDPLFDDTEKQIEMDPNIIFVGYQNDVRPYFAISHALAFPSYREGFPNVVMQAGAMGLPAIVTDINGCNEIVEDGVNGIIVPPKQVEPLVSSMFHLMRDQDFYQQLKYRSRELITSRYEQQNVWNAILEEYNANILSWQRKNSLSLKANEENAI